MDLLNIIYSFSLIRFGNTVNILIVTFYCNNDPEELAYRVTISDGAKEFVCVNAFHYKPTPYKAWALAINAIMDADRGDLFMPQLFGDGFKK